ncbi:MAG: hypothetical protein ACXW53_03850 [Candidatus Binatia bacterium]
MTMPLWKIDRTTWHTGPPLWSGELDETVASAGDKLILLAHRLFLNESSGHFAQMIQKVKCGFGNGSSHRAKTSNSHEEEQNYDE